MLSQRHDGNTRHRVTAVTSQDRSSGQQRDVSTGCLKHIFAAVWLCWWLVVWFVPRCSGVHAAELTCVGRVFRVDSYGLAFTYSQSAEDFATLVQESITKMLTGVGGVKVITPLVMRCM